MFPSASRSISLRQIGAPMLSRRLRTSRFLWRHTAARRQVTDSTALLLYELPQSGVGMPADTGHGPCPPFPHLQRRSLSTLPPSRPFPARLTARLRHILAKRSAHASDEATPEKLEFNFASPKTWTEADYEARDLDILRPSMERLDDYRVGGHHPVHLGDLLDDGRYRVFHKISDYVHWEGAHANVWMVRDLESEKHTTVLLQILMAEKSTEDPPKTHLRTEQANMRFSASAEHVHQPLRSFRIQGPNGSHLCFVYFALWSAEANPDWEGVEWAMHCGQNSDFRRQTAYEATKALAFFHEEDGCHGGEMSTRFSDVCFTDAPLDFRPENILFRFDDIRGGEICLPEPDVIALMNESGEEPTTLSAPQHIVLPLPNTPLHGPILLRYPGDCFSRDRDNHELASKYRSPELILGPTRDKSGVGRDLWTLGCFLFELRTGLPMIPDYLSGQSDPIQLLNDMSRRLGCIPNSDLSDWEFGSDQVELIRDQLSSNWRFQQCNEEGGQCNEVNTTTEGMDTFIDLFTKLCRFRPEDRISAKEALKHEWFKKHDSYCEEEKKMEKQLAS